MTPDLGQLRVFAERYTVAWCNMDPVAVAAHNAPEGSLAINGGAPAVGRDAIEAVAASFYQALPDMQLFFRDLAMNEDWIEYHWTFTGTNTGPGGTGNAVTATASASNPDEGYGRDLELQDRTEIAS